MYGYIQLYKNKKLQVSETQKKKCILEWYSKNIYLCVNNNKNKSMRKF